MITIVIRMDYKFYMKKKEKNSAIRTNLKGLDKVSGSAIIKPAKTTHYDPLGMAGFCL